MRTRLKNKLKRVHIGKDIWQCGAINPKMIVDGKKTSHLVVYGPNRKLFHLYGDDELFTNDGYPMPLNGHEDDELIENFDNCGWKFTVCEALLNSK